MFLKLVGSFHIENFIYDDIEMLIYVYLIESQMNRQRDTANCVPVHTRGGQINRTFFLIGL